MIKIYNNYLFRDFSGTYFVYPQEEVTEVVKMMSQNRNKIYAR